MVKLLPTYNPDIFINPKYIASIEIKTIDFQYWDHLNNLPPIIKYKYLIVATMNNGKEITLSKKDSRDEAYGFIGEFADFIGG